MYQATQDPLRADPPRRRLDRPAAWVFLGVVAVIGATILTAVLLIAALASTLSNPSGAWVWYVAAVLAATAAVAASVWLNRLDRE